MALQIKTFRVSDSDGEQAVNTFLAGKRVHHWEASYGGDPSLGMWNLLVAYEEDHYRERNDRDGRDRDRGERPRRMEQRPAEPRKAPRIEHAAPEIPSELIPLYENIRKWRNQIARDEKIKPYILFNNKQLEDLVKTPPTDTESLKKIVPDMNDDLFSKYSNQVLGLFSAAAPVEA
jgi:ATP-dependent DNA helicase RecQ